MHHFFAYLSRLKFIRRWGLMRSTQPENDAEHSLQVAMIAHGIAVIARDRYGKTVEPEHVLALAVYHDATEVITGDLPTPVKYHSPELRTSYKQLEGLASRRLIAMLPQAMQPAFEPYLTEGEDYAHQLVKAADRVSAYIKCVEEKRSGNHEFDAAGENVLRSIRQIDLPEVRDFMEEFVPSYALTLDELNSLAPEQKHGPTG
ncbi:MAG: 5'-deoxynucleotidase [Clostridiales bacterium]|nr:5'-deoxynucleotidase [Clostridiales bacterium]